MKLHHVRQEIARNPWAILPGKLEAMLEVVEWHAAGNQAPAYEAAAPRAPATTGGVAVIPVYGLIAQRMNMMTAFSGGTSTDMLAAQLDAALKDPSIKGIVFDVDSPGGSVYGVPELAARIYKARGQKRMVSVSNALMASAAYWIGSAVDEMFITPSGELGSIGVVAAHYDFSKMAEAEGVKVTYITYGKHKAELAEEIPLSDDARAYLQSRVDDYGQMFDKAVAKHLGVETATVRDSFGQGRVFGAKDAVKLGMAHHIGTLQDAIERAGMRQRNTEALDRKVALLERTA